MIDKKGRFKGTERFREEDQSKKLKLRLKTSFSLHGWKIVLSR